MVAPLILEERYGLVSSDMILLIYYLDRVLGIGQICFERCHFRQYYIHGCFQTLLQLRHVEDVMNSCQGWQKLQFVCNGSTLLQNGKRSDVVKC
jgi:hypothetical protein